MKAPLRLLLSFIVQVAVFIAVHKIGYTYGIKLHGSPRSNISWGISLQLAMVIYCFIAFIVAVYVNMVSKFISGLIVVLIASFVFSLFWMKNFHDLPYRTALLLASALIGFSSSLIFSLRRRKQPKLNM